MWVVFAQCESCCGMDCRNNLQGLGRASKTRAEPDQQRSSVFLRSRRSKTEAERARHRLVVGKDQDLPIGRLCTVTTAKEVGVPQDEKPDSVRGSAYGQHFKNHSIQTCINHDSRETALWAQFLGSSSFNSVLSLGLVVPCIGLCSVTVSEGSNSSTIDEEVNLCLWGSLS